MFRHTNMTTEEKNEIISSVKEILDSAFDISQKKVVLEYPDRLNFACPYCGDSDNVAKKRGNIYLTDLNYHCFNCGKHTDFFAFVKDFGVHLGMDTIETLSAARTKKRGKNKASFDLVLFNEMEELALSRKDMRNGFRLIEIPNQGKIHDYLKSRCLLKNRERFMYNSYRDELYVLNLTRNGKVAGFQIRSFDPDKVKYRTYNISKIYERTGRNIDEKYEQHLDLLNQISITFNLMTVSLLDTLYVFEGGIDSFFLPNSIGMCGVGRHVDLVEDLPNTRYFFDNDKAGYKKTFEKLRDGKSVFLWNKFLMDNGFDGKIKDLNELVIYLVRNRIPFDFNRIGEWFSDDELDAMQI